MLYRKCLFKNTVLLSKIYSNTCITIQNDVISPLTYNTVLIAEYSDHKFYVFIQYKRLKKNFTNYLVKNTVL